MRRILKINTIFVFIIIIFISILSPIFAEEVRYVNEPQFVITVPKNIDLNKDKTFTYKVVITGELDKYMAISVIPDESFYMIEQSDSLNKKEDVLATVSQNKTLWTSDDLDINAEGTVEAPGLTAGKWSGYFNFNISIQEREIDYKLFILNKYNYGEVGIKELSGDIVIPLRFEKNDDIYKIVEIEEYTFSDCHLLKSVVIPDSIDKVNKGLFKNCYSFNSVIISNNTTEICEEAFSNCHNLKEINIPESLEKIGDRAFYGCFSLPNLKLSNDITYIGEQAFYDCHAMSLVTIPDNITHIGKEAFGNFYNLKNVIYKGVNYTSLTKLYNDLRNNGVIVYDNTFTNTQLSK